MPPSLPAGGGAHTLYVVNTGDGTVSVINGATCSTSRGCSVATLVLTWFSETTASHKDATPNRDAAQALREVLGVPLQHDQQADHEQALQAMRVAVGEEAFAAAWAEGRAMTLEEAVALALADRSRMPAE